MRIIIAGSRDARDWGLVRQLIEISPFDISAVVSGCATGVDAMGERYALEKGLHIYKYPAKWEEFGNSAGPKRNTDMARNADGLILVWSGHSSGSANMLFVARMLKLPYVSYSPLDVDNPDPEHRRYKIHMVQNLYNYSALAIDTARECEFQVLVPIDNPKS